MKKNTVILSAAALVALLCSWNPQKENTLEKASWLIGTWEHTTSRGSVYENWTRTSEQEYLGKSYMLKEKDTLVFETIRLVEERDTVFYIPLVKDQNKGLPVKFALKSGSGNELVFENKGHDFPQIISYKKIGADSLLAEISGTIKGKVRQQQFPMKKIH